MKKLTSTLCLILLSACMFSQGIFVSTQNNEIFEVGPNNNLRLVTTLTGTFAQPMFDIAISPSGEFYALIDKTIIKVDTSNGSSSLIATLNLSGLYSSLVCSNDNLLYTIDDKLKEMWKLDLTDSSFTKVAYIGFETPGDLTFYRGHIIFPTVSLAKGSLIKAFNLQNHSLKDIFCLDTMYNPWGISTVFNTCGQSQVFISEAGYTFNFYELNINQGMGYLSSTTLATSTDILVWKQPSKW